MSLFATSSIETLTLTDKAPASRTSAPERTAGNGCLHAIDVRLTPSGGDFGFPTVTPPARPEVRANRDTRSGRD